MVRNFIPGRLNVLQPVILSLAFLFFMGSSVFGEEEARLVERIHGQDRYETAAKIAESKYDKAETVIIARGDTGGYADGLAGNVIAGALDAPVLLVNPEFLPEATAAALDRLKTEEAVILGGENAVSAEVENNLGVETRRIAGQSREETAALIAQKAAEKTQMADYAFIVNGTAPADSLVVGSKAAADNAAILQVKPWGEGIPRVTEELIEELGIKRLVIVGGEAVVTENEYQRLSKLAQTERVYGDNRFATSVAVAERFYDSPERIILSGGTEDRLADALAGGVLAAANRAPVIYFCSPDEAVVGYLSEISTPHTRALILGGDNSVSEDIQEGINNLLLESGDLEIREVRVVDESYLQVVFDDGTLRRITDFEPAPLEVGNNEIVLNYNGLKFEKEVEYRGENYLENIHIDCQEKLNLHTVVVDVKSKVFSIEFDDMEMHYEGDNQYSIATTRLSDDAEVELKLYDKYDNLIQIKKIAVSNY